MTAAVLMALLLPAVQTVHTGLGMPVTVDYAIPEGYTPLPLEESEGFTVLNQQGDSVTIVPLVLDTLSLPAMTAVYDSMESDFQPPVVIVDRTMPDTTWTVPVFTAPLDMHIPPGLPLDYLLGHCFWLEWGPAPSGRWILPAAIGLAVLLAAAAVWYFRRRKKAGEGREEAGSGSAASPLDEVEALLDSKAFAEGRWQEYYKDVDRLLRDTVAFRFGVSNRAYTWPQIGRHLSDSSEGRRFFKDSKDLTREIILQRYAGWGGSRDRARRYTRSLLEIRREWHRR